MHWEDLEGSGGEGGGSGDRDGERKKKKEKEESEKVDLKLNIQKTKIMASGPITSWKIDGETTERVRNFIWRAPKSLQILTATVNFFFHLFVLVGG